MELGTCAYGSLDVGMDITCLVAQICSEIRKAGSSPEH